MNENTHHASALQGHQSRIIANTGTGGTCQNCVCSKKHGQIPPFPAENQAIMKYNWETAVKDNFSELHSLKKFKAIEQTLDACVRPSLQQAGQDIDVEDFTMKGDIPVVFISFYGLCGGCGASAMLNSIQNILKKVLHPNFQVKIAPPNMPSSPLI